MKNLLQTLIIFLLPFLLQAQITLTSADIASVGDVVSFANPAATGIILPDSGANHTWDFSTLQTALSPITTDSFISPASTAFSRQTAGISNLVIKTLGTNTFLNKRITGTNQGIFVSAIALSTIPIPGQSGPLFFKLSREYARLTLPSTYGTIYTGNTSGKVTIKYDTSIANPSNPSQNINVDSVRVTINLTADSKFDGWGTIKFPGGNIYPVLRQRYLNQISFALEVRSYITFLGTRIGIWIPLPLGLPANKTQVISFWTNGEKEAIAAFTADSAGTVSSVTFKKDLIAGVGGIANLNSFKIFPNPAKNSVLINYPGQDMETEKRALVFNSIGQLVMDKRINGFPSSELDISGLTAGTYWLQLQSKNGLLSERSVLVKQ